jgi:hypothetical protein
LVGEPRVHVGHLLHESEATNAKIPRLTP